MHCTTRRFWQCYNVLPDSVQRTADECYKLLKADPSHPSLHFKKLGKKYWSVRAGLNYRALREPKTMTHEIRCHCGKLKGTFSPSRAINRCVCYCADCQAFARFLGQAHQVLDRQGGTRIVQTIPANLTFTEGMEHLSCLRLTPKGLLRWYAACCNTPIGNTLPTLNLSFVGLIDTCFSADQTSLDRAFGPIQMYVNTESAIGEEKPKSAEVLSGTLRVLGMMLRARFDGRYKQNPFFSIETGAPIVAPKVLSEAELNCVKGTVQKPLF